MLPTPSSLVSTRVLLPTVFQANRMRLSLVKKQRKSFILRSKTGEVQSHAVEHILSGQAMGGDAF